MPAYALDTGQASIVGRVLTLDNGWRIAATLGGKVIGLLEGRAVRRAEHRARPRGVNAGALHRSRRARAGRRRGRALRRG